MDGTPDLFGRVAPGRSARPRGRAGRVVGDAMADEAADARAREAFLRRSAAEEGSFAGVLLDLAERGVPVLVAGAGGRRQRGVLGRRRRRLRRVRTPEARAVLWPTAASRR